MFSLYIRVNGSLRFFVFLGSFSKISNEVFLRTVRDDALRAGNYADVLALHEKLHPELFEDAPLINVDNVNTAANLSLLLRRSGQVAAADQLIDAALSWYRASQVPGVYGTLINIVNVELLALKGEKENAMDKSSA